MTKNSATNVYSQFIRLYEETVQLVRDRADKAEELLRLFEGDSWTDSAKSTAEGATNQLSVVGNMLDQELGHVKRVVGKKC